MVLSGMSSMEQMKDNLSYMKDFQPLNETELEAVKKVQSIFRGMNLIPCTDPCIYQRDGRCTLPRAGSGGSPTGSHGCVHFLPRQPASQQNRQGLADVSYRDQL